MRDRAVTTALNYALLLGIVSILVSTLVFGVGGLVDNQQERAIRSQLEVAGNRLANDVAAVGGIPNQTDADVSVSLTSDLPERSVGSRYTISVSDGASPNRYQLTLQSTDPDVVVTVEFRSSTTVQPATVRGGQIEVVYDPSKGVILRD
jgi:type II secretory pathway pseudopilin PulG